ncbi:D-alanyl-D-alanine carboxypeptidase [Vibrio ponticus]|nr:D-alanyl-D-alanine carboxypeptidase [Vibrio ponticus]
MEAELVYNGDLVAPIQAGQVVGEVVYTVGGDEVAKAELTALESVDEGSIFKRIIDWFKMLIASWL